jgi:dTMP kinase
LFISFEGIEASGKSTLMGAVDHALRSGGRRTLLTREPGGTAAGDTVRRIFLQGEHLTPITEALLMNASRAELVEAVIRPALQAGTVVLCDRYVHSTLAYQGYGRGLALDLLRRICDAATAKLMPEITLFVDVSYETSCARLAARGSARDRMEREDAAFYERVRAGYVHLAQVDPRVIRLDGERSAEEVADAALAAISAVLA